MRPADVVAEPGAETLKPLQNKHRAPVVETDNSNYMSERSFDELWNDYERDGYVDGQHPDRVLGLTKDAP